MLTTGLSAIALAIVALALAIASAPAGGGARAQAGGDLTGSWSAAYHMTCQASFVQTGTSVSGDVDCGGELVIELAGTVQGGAFTLTGAFGLVPLDVSGTIAGTGQSLSGTFAFVPIVPEGSFTGERTGGSGADLTGDWAITVADVFAGDCFVDLEQSGSDLEAGAECGDQPLGTLTGTYDRDTGAIVLSGPFGVGGIEIAATVAGDGQSFTGTWAITPAAAGAPTGVIEGVRLSGPPGDGDDGDDGEGPAATTTPAPAVLPETGSGGGSGSLVFALAAVAAAALALAGPALLVAGARRRR